MLAHRTPFQRLFIDYHPYGSQIRALRKIVYSVIVYYVPFVLGGVEL